MKRMVITAIIILSNTCISQDLSVFAGAAWKSYQLQDQSSYGWLQQNDGLSKSLYGVKLSFGAGINFLVFNYIELSCLYSKKTLFDISIPVTTEEFPDGPRQYISFKEQFEDIEIVIVPKYFFDVFEKGRIGGNVRDSIHILLSTF
jgi:hypothetical protein